ncbi:DJ-1/PfpI family protein [Amycolatopsis pithecellobii]|uniref:DJ-1/PfpI family protein n=1 Tax=Amycolatopsis pithecellobii TaxID=664692 RepID=UPI001AA09EBE|nr:DJ-1/PfpI family protein [Amycolatopsis pithecellobii]
MTINGVTRVDVLVFDGVDDLDVVAPYEVLQRAGRIGAGISVNLVTLDGRPSVATQNGLRLGDASAWAPEKADVVLVPGGGFAAGGPTGVRAELESGRVPEALREANRPGLVFASVCTGAILLAAAGLVRGRPCTTHHAAVTELEAAGGRHVTARVVDDGDLVTAGGVTSGLDLALWLVERYAGAETALRLEKGFEYERRGTVWRDPERAR